MTVTSKIEEKFKRSEYEVLTGERQRPRVAGERFRLSSEMEAVVQRLVLEYGNSYNRSRNYELAAAESAGLWPSRDNTIGEMLQYAR